MKSWTFYEFDLYPSSHSNVYIKVAIELVRENQLFTAQELLLCLILIFKMIQKKHVTLIPFKFLL